ncbi:MAG: hypothetical protein LBG76_01565 [Treponema sp.]|jgi:hypothetical protein|nr:hypothetical protein [Treponema sp.]
MVTKRRNLNEAINRGMEGRSIGAPSDKQAPETLSKKSANAAPKTQRKAKGYKSNIVSIRFDSGDYERLKEIAQEQGTNGAALIRKAVKDIIKAAEKP